LADIIDLFPKPRPGLITRRILEARKRASQAFQSGPIETRDQSFERFKKLQSEFLRRAATGEFDAELE